MALAEFQRAKIDSLVQKLIAAGMPNSMIQAQVDSAKAAMPDVTGSGTRIGKIGVGPEPTTPAAQALSNALPPPDFLSNMAWQHPGTLAATIASLTINPAARASLLERLLAGTGRAMMAGGGAELASQEVGQAIGKRPQKNLLDALKTASVEAGTQGLANIGGNVGGEVVRQIGRGLGKTAFRMVDAKRLGDVWDTMIKERVPVGAYMGQKGSEVIGNRIEDESGLLKRVLDEMQARGDMLTPENIAQNAIADQQAKYMVQRGYGITPDERANLVKNLRSTFNEVLTNINRNEPPVRRLINEGMTGVETPINTPNELQVVKQDISKRRAEEYANMRAKIPSPAKPVTQSEMDVAAGIKQSLENLPQTNVPTGLTPWGTPRNVEDINARTSSLMDLHDAMQQAEGYKTPFLSRYALPYIAAGAGTGALLGHDVAHNVSGAGLGGTLGAALAFHAFTSPRALSRLSLLLTDPILQRLVYQQGGRGIEALTQQPSNAGP